MVKAAAFALVVAACTPDIAPGAYLCGPEESCPEGLACNAGVDMDPATPDNVCVVPGVAQPFACGVPDFPDDDPATGRIIANLSCVSPANESKGCLNDGDVGDWYQFDVPANCNAVQIEARLRFPVAFEPLAMQLATDGGAPMPADTPCSGTQQADDGEEIRCFKLTVTNGSHQAIGVVHSATDNCDGACAHNRYTLSVQLSTP